MKPRIYFKQGIWYCEDAKWWGYGDTIQEAFSHFVFIRDWKK